MRNGFYKRGISGYDPEYPDMRGVFMARGPGNYHINMQLCGNTQIFCHTITREVLYDTKIYHTF